MLRIVVTAAAVLLGSCATYRIPGTQGQAMARVTADPVVSAGLPVRVVLRRVDSQRVDSRYASAEVPAGRHEFLVDCSVAETGATSRHVIVAELEPGGRYRFVAIASTRRCESVVLEPR